jgi:CRISPR-associated protein Csy2
MVNSMHIREILGSENIVDRNKSLRHAFSAYTESIDVTGCENEVLIILLNLTYRKNQVEDLLDKKLARTALNNGDHISKCIEEVQWFHTHNLKYPDIRVSKQNLAVDSPLLHPRVLSSANYERRFGWTHNSAQVNTVKFLLSYFYWQGESYCLAEILSKSEKGWKAAFQSLGMPVKSFINVCGRIRGLLPNTAIPNSVDRYSTQVRMPYHDGYVALTPVVSHALQSTIQQAARKKQGRFDKVTFTRSAAVSELVASIGGFVNTLSYLPYIGRKSHGLHHSRLFQMENGNGVFNNNVLLKNSFTKALDGLIYSGGLLALKQRRQQKVVSNKEIRNTLTSWLAPILEWRLEVIEGRVGLDLLEKIPNRLTRDILAASDDELPEFSSSLFSLLNTVLSNLPSTQKYAFHPKLITPLRSALKWLLSNITNEDTSTKPSNDETCRYLYLKDIRVFDAQTLSNPYCIGTPSLTAVWGMMHNYQRKLNEALNTKVRFTSFSWFIKEYSTVAGKKLPEVGLQGVKQNELRRPSIIDNKYCDLVFDLVIHIDGYEDDLLLLDESTNLLKAHFPSTLAGGAMHPPELDVTMQWCNLYHDERLLFDKLRRLPLSGRWVMPTKHKIHDLEELLSLLTSNSSLSPTMFGYMLLDKPKTRPGSLEKVHCYAEPAIGVIEYKTAINIRIKGIRNYFNQGFWMLDAQEEFMLMKSV